MLPTVKQFLKPESRFYSGIWLGKDTTHWDLQQDCQIKDNQKADNASQTQPATTGLCTHRPMEDTSVSTAYTYSHNTSYNASSKQSAHISEGCSNKRSSRRQETERVTIERSAHKAEEDSRANYQWLHHQRIRKDRRCQHHRLHHTGERDDAIAEGSADEQQRTTAERQALERPTTTEQPKMQNEDKCHQVGNQRWKQMETTSNEDTEEIDNEKILLEPLIHDTEGWIHNKWRKEGRKKCNK